MGLCPVKMFGRFLGATALAFVYRGELAAQELHDAPKKDKPVVVRRFFDRPIDYWDQGLEFEDESKRTEKGEKGPEAGPAQKSTPSEWGQMVKLPDGTLTYHELPRPLVDLFENPTPENIRAYFAFRMSKTQKILRAAELMKEYRASVSGRPEEPGGAGAPAASEPRGAAGPPDRGARLASLPSRPAETTPFSVTYFHRKNCPHCDSQDLILAAWLKDKPEGKLEVIEFGARPELWQAYRVRGTPSLILEDSGTRRTAFLEGLSRPEALDRTLSECRADALRDRAAKGEGPK